MASPFFHGQLTDLKQSLDTLKQSLIDEQNISMYASANKKSNEGHSRIITRQEVLNKIEDVMNSVVKDVSSDKPPSLTYASSTTWNDVRFDRERGFELRPDHRWTTVRFDSLPSMKKFGLMMKVMSIMYRLVKTDHYCTKRDIYYQDTELFGNQHTLDGIVDNISCMLKVPRWHLHVLATSKGCIVGDLVFQDADNNYIDCRHTLMGIQVPNHVNGMHNVVTNAHFILVVEKDATFQKLVESRFCDKLHPCILVTGKGYPDINTRFLLRKLWDNFTIPIFALVDADPHGIEIMAVYKFGSKALSFETENLAIPCLKWLGLLPSDIHRLGIPERALITMTKADKSKAAELQSRPYMQHYPQWHHEVDTLLSLDRKAEIQSLDAISTNFLCDVYLPSKLKCSGWL